MAKGKGKINSSDGLAPPEPRSLRSRKREYPCEEIQATLHQQDMDNIEENNTAVVGTLRQEPQIPLKDSAIITKQQDQAVRPDDPKEVRHIGETSVHLTDMTNKTFEGPEETAAVTSSSHDATLEGFRVQTDNDTKNSRMEEITLQESIGSLSRTCANQLQVFLPTSEESDGYCVLPLEKEQGAKDNSQCNLERNHETSQDHPSKVSMADVKENRQEAEAGLPAKKKRRMGMCGLTEKERSNFLQTQRRENGQSRVEGVEKQIYNCNTADLVAQEDIISSHLCPSPPKSIPAEQITEQGEAEAKLQLSFSAGNDRAENEVHNTVPNSDVCDPGCLEEKSCETAGGTEDGQEQTGEPAEDEVEMQSDNKEQQELVGSTSENVPEIPVKQLEDGDDRSTEVDYGPAVSFCTTPPQSEETEKEMDRRKTKAEKREEMMTDADSGAEVEGAPLTCAEPGGLNCSSVELCESAVTPAGSERKDSCDLDDEPAATVNTEHTQTSITTDPFGSGCMDYVSDSQLNTIVLLEEEVMEKRADLGSSTYHEDATDLICGLIRELSSLNRKVMATHKELENLRRGSKTPRSSSR